MKENKLAEAVQRFRQQDFAGAERLCAQILRRESNNTGALHLLGVVHLSAGDPRQAITLLGKALLYAPGDAAILENLGLAQLAARDALAAERVFRKLIDSGSSHGLLHMRLGLALNLQGRFADAESALRMALALSPDEPDVYLNLGNVLAAQERDEAAVAVLDTMLVKWPQHRDALYNRGALLQKLRRFEEASAAYADAIRVDPAHMDSHNNRGIVLEQMGRLDEAMACYRKVLDLDVAHVHALSNLGKALRTQGRLEESARSCQRALDIEPTFVDALLNLAGVRGEQGATVEALQLYQRILELSPDDAEAHRSYGMLCLGMGRFEEGWRHYQWRPQRKQALTAGIIPDASLPDDIAGKRVLLIGEQGIGDEVFFLRYAVAIKQRGAHLVCLCDDKIASILQRAELFNQIAVHGAALPDGDVRFLVGDLPLVVGTAAAERWNVQPASLCLTVLEERVRAMRTHLAGVGPAPYIGITWRAGTPPEEQQGRVDRALFKQVPLAQFGAALEQIPGTVISLQRKLRAGEMDAAKSAFRRDVHDFSRVNDDLEDMLALLTLMHEYVGVSNTNMHLMAGLGGRARVLVPNPPEWRWMCHGTVSPWFAGFALYRQSTDGDWTKALRDLALDLGQAPRV